MGRPFVRGSLRSRGHTIRIVTVVSAAGRARRSAVPDADASSYAHPVATGLDSTSEPVPRAALVVDALHLNGAVKITVDLAQRWARGGTVLVALKDIPPESRIQIPSGARIRVINRVAGLGGFGAARVLLRLVGIARRSDVVLVGSEIGIGLIFGYAASRIARRPLVIAVHADLDDALDEWISPRLRPVMRWVHRRADGVICVEEALTGPVIANGLPADRISVVTNGVDVEGVRRASRGEDTQAGLPGPHIVLTGRLAAQKGTDLMIRAHAQIVGEVPHTVLLLNDGPDTDELRRLTEEFGVTGSVRFAGRVPPHPTVAHAALFCLPSRHEGLPLALLEAMAVGTPTIATDCSAGVRAALDDGRAGRLVPVDDVASLAGAIRDHLTDREPLQRLAEHATEHLAKFDLERMAAGWAAAVDAVVGRSRR